MCLPLTVTSGTVLAPRYTESAFACSLIGVRDGREYGFFNLNLCLDFSFSLSNSSMEIVSPPPLFFLEVMTGIAAFILLRRTNCAPRNFLGKSQSTSSKCRVLM